MRFCYDDDVLGHEEKNGHYKFKVRIGTPVHTNEGLTAAKYLSPKYAPKDFAEYLREDKVTRAPAVRMVERDRPTEVERGAKRLQSRDPDMQR